MTGSEQKQSRCGDNLRLVSALLFVVVLVGGAAAPGGPKEHPIRLALASLGLALTGVAWSGFLWKKLGKQAVIGARLATYQGADHDSLDLQQLVSGISLQLLAALILLALFGGLWEWVQFPWLQTLDETVVHHFYHSGGPQFTRMMRAISDAGGRDLLIYTVPALLISLLIFRRRASAVFLSCTMFGTFGLEVLFKTLSHRSRPDLVRGVHFDSFPSGHTLAATILAGSLFLLLSPACRRPKDRILLTAATLAWPVMMGATRVYLGRHYVTDVIAGILLGAAWVFFCHALSGTFAVATLPTTAPPLLHSKENG